MPLPAPTWLGVYETSAEASRPVQAKEPERKPWPHQLNMPAFRIVNGMISKTCSLGLRIGVHPYPLTLVLES